MSDPRTLELTVETALQISQGLDVAIFPVGRNKAPLLKGRGLHDASKDPTLIREMWTQAGGRAYIGVNCGSSDLTVIDADGELSPELQAALFAHPTLMFRSLYRGMGHFYYRGRRASGPIKNGDIKSIGGYVLLSPDSEMLDLPIANWNAELEEAVLASPAASHTPSGSTDSDSDWKPENTEYGLDTLIGTCYTLSQEPKGTRNHSLHRAAFTLGHLIAEGRLELDTVVDALKEASLSNGLIDDDGESGVDATIRSGLKFTIERRIQALEDIAAELQ